MIYYFKEIIMALMLLKMLMEAGSLGTKLKALIFQVGILKSLIPQKC